MYPDMSTPNNRKRPAPESPPLIPIQQAFSGSSDSITRWAPGPDPTVFVDTSADGMNTYGLGPSQGQVTHSLTASPSNAIARRPVNNALVPANLRQPFDWSVRFDDQSLFTSSSTEGMDDNDTVEVLLEKAQRAKRDAASKRKQIPPFVQKLSSFLNEQKNTDLIRWSEKGDSFIVLDEEEFAKTLIPELFKHNNYASFVRQLNMYGFHKRVGLSDNSMKASERKNKSPSEYHNPYFRRGFPDLLWLINKPRNNAGKKKKKEDGELDSDDEIMVEDSISQGAVCGSGKAFSGEIGTLPKKDLALVHDELKLLQDRQTRLQTAIARITKDQKELINRAVIFQQLHDRHDRSINLILSFLANVYRKSLEDSQGGNVAELLASILPSTAQAPQGTVIDYENFVNDSSNHHQPTVNSTPKRAQRLLPGIPQHRHSAITSAPSSASVDPSSAAGFAGMAPPYLPRTGTVTEVLDPSPADATGPAYLKQTLKTNPQEGMMKILEGTRAAAQSSSSVAIPSNVANTASVMTNNHRAQLFDAMATQTSNTAPELSIPSPVATTPSIVGGIPASHSSTPMSTANVQSFPTSVSTPNVVGVTTSPLSLGTPKMSCAVPTIDDLSLGAPQPPLTLHNIPSQAEIDEIQRLSDEQSSKLTDLAHLLGPLSPSGRIPGIDENGNPATYFDVDQFLNQDAFPSEDGADLSFDASGLVGADMGGVAGEIPGFSLDENAPAAAAAAVAAATQGGSNAAEMPSSGMEQDTRDDIRIGTGYRGRGEGGDVLHDRKAKRQRI